MSVSGRPVRQIFNEIVSRDLSPEARRRLAADFARARLAEAAEHNRRATGRAVAYEQVVDGRVGAALESVNPDRGRIVFNFQVGPDAACRWISTQLVLHAPVLTGRFRDSFRFFAGGREIEPGTTLPKANEYVFLSPLPYSRRLEKHVMEENGTGLFQAVAVLAKERFGDVVNVKFSFRAPGEFGLQPYVPLGAGRRRNRGAGGRFTATPSQDSAETRAAAGAERAARTPAIVVSPFP